MATFADALDDMDSMIMSSLNDGCGDYFDAAGRCVARGVELIVDRNLQRVGPEGGVFITEQTGIQFRRCAIDTVARGGLFVHGNRRYLVEEEIDDDGNWVTVACMEQRR